MVLCHRFIDFYCLIFFEHRMRVIGMKTAGKHFDHPVELFYLFWKPITKHFSLWICPRDVIQTIWNLSHFFPLIQTEKKKYLILHLYDFMFMSHAEIRIGVLCYLYQLDTNYQEFYFFYNIQICPIKCLLLSQK